MLKDYCSISVDKHIYVYVYYIHYILNGLCLLNGIKNQ